VTPSSLLLAALLTLGEATGGEVPVAPAAPGATTTATATTSDEVVQGAKSSTPESRGTPDDSLQQYRSPVDALTDRSIGVASRAVRFDWRRSRFGLELLGGQLLELNNFVTWRVGLVGRIPVKGLMLELGANAALTYGSASSNELAATPYRQEGRPSRLELDGNVSYPLAEGVATPRTDFLPAAELVLSATVGLRYLYYPNELANFTVGNGALALVKPHLTTQELTNLEPQRLPAMQIDEGRYDLLAGFTFDVYVQSGGFVAPRVMIAPPLTSTGLGWWWELSIAAGWMF
jgi:hypothetical protein